MNQLLCKKNIPFLYLIFSVAGVGAFSATDNLYWDFSGYSIWEISLMASLFNIGVAIAELPFAIYFDNYSNKKSLQIANILRIISFTIFFIDGNIYWILFGQLVAGVGYAASSGSSEALILNNMPRDNGSDRVMFLGYSKIYFITSLTALISGALGIGIYHIYPQGIWALAISFFALSLITIFFLEDKVTQETQVPLKDFLVGLNVVFKEKTTYLLILVNSAAVAPFIIWQIKIGRESLLYLFLGFFAMKLFATLASPFLRSIKISKSTVYTICVYNIIAVALFSIIEQTLLAVLFFGFHVFGQAMITIFSYGEFHSKIENSIRASASSIVSLLDSAVVLLIAPLVGFLASEINIGSAILVSSISYLIILIYIFSIRKYIEIK
ncbi:MFS transporter [Rothia nasimurium]|uniref:MFS transporter n=1 Tax=Rothia nasimurium TaxID=85336 RepID=A0A4Y9F1S0_9MICC|nr:MFS transporter [Rothia nasimurium]MBF0809235.1 MFS transporter [Rothia nasimurium]TFU20376.1 MFS transporter [Rothia nasimurium]